MKTLSLADGIEQCAKIGFRNVEFTLYPGYPSEPEALSADARRAVSQQLRRLGLAASCLKSRPDPAATPEARRRANQEVTAAARLAIDLAVPSPPLVAVHVGGKTDEWEKLKEFIVDQVGGWAEISKKLGVPFALKPHVGNAVDRPERLLWLIDRIPRLRTVYDYSHFSLINVDLEQSLRALRPHISVVQVKDARQTADGKHEFLLPGDGGFDYVRYFKALDKIDFMGPVVVEVSAQLFNRKDYDPVVAAQRSYQVLAEALAARHKR